MEKQQRNQNGFHTDKILRPHHIHCKNNKIATHVCFSKNCEENAFMCGDKICICKLAHQQCLKILLEDLIEKIQKKIHNVQPFIQEYDRFANATIEKLIENIQKIKKQFKISAEEKFKFLSLTEEEKSLWIKITQNKVSEIKGQQFFNICSQFSNKSKSQNLQRFQKEFDRIKQIWVNLQKKIQNQFNKISQSSSKSILLSSEIWMQKSKIIKKNEQSQIIKSFFDKKIRKLEKLYVASQNQFKLQNFYKNCTNIPNTILLIQTQYNKKIGGFTGLAWKKVDKQQILTDSTNETFIFSVDNSEKFSQIDQSSGIVNYPEYGPRFSRNGNDDILIRSEANKNSFSSGCFNKAFTNSKHTEQSSAELRRFNGNPNHSAYFKIKQWQVWRVYFQ